MKKIRLKKGILLAGGILISIMILVYLAGVYFFQGHYYWGTVIDGENYSLMTPGMAENVLKKKAAAYELTIQGRNDVTDVITAAQLELQPVFDGSLEKISKEQNGFLWLNSFNRENEYEIEKFAEYNEEQFKKQLSGLNLFKAENRSEPKDAYIGEYSSESGQYAIVSEVQGNSIIRGKAEESIRGAVGSLTEQLDMDTEGCYKKPTVTVHSPTINKVLHKMNKYVSAQITYDYNGEQAVIGGELIHQWLSTEGTKVILDEEAVREYINGLARVHDTFGRKREFVKTGGETITIASGAYGFWTNRSGETEKLIASIKAGEKTEREPLYYSKGYTEGKNDIGTSYVEIDLGKQHLYLYKEGKLILESDFVSGSAARNFLTPPGVYGLTYKERDATLRGQGYNSAVKYWMPFNGNIGMHDAGWRREFGGDIYKTNGSHGCINLPSDTAEKIYEQVEKGFPVVCYN